MKQKTARSFATYYKNYLHETVNARQLAALVKRNWIISELASYSSTLKKEAVRSSEMTINLYQTKRNHTSRYSGDYSHRRDNLKVKRNRSMHLKLTWLPSLRGTAQIRSTMSSCVWSLTINGFWIRDRIYCTVWYSAWLHFAVHYYTHTSVQSRLHWPLFGSGFQLRTFPFLWDRSATSF
jgi:hypothetical protein